MRLSRIDLLPLLAIMAGGVLGASLSFSFLALSPSGVPAPDPVVAPALTLEDRFEVESEVELTPEQWLRTLRSLGYIQ